MSHPSQDDDPNDAQHLQSEPGRALPAQPDAEALAETNYALQADMAELAATRDRLCREADEFERGVKERTAELEAIIGSLPDAVYIGDEHGITHCNQRGLDLLGFGSGDELRAAIPVLSAKLQNRYADTGEPIAPEDEAFARALRGEPWTHEVISRNLKTGKDVIQRSAANPILLDGQVIGAVAVNTDITELKRTERALREAVARLSEREAALLETTAQLEQTQDELEARVAERTAELAASQAQLRTLTHRLVEVQEDERRSLARDLHDTSGQAMTVINMGLAMLRRELAARGPGAADPGATDKTQARIDELRRVADTVAEDLHRLSVNLRPSSLDRYGLVPALDDLLGTMRKQAAVEVDFRVEGLEERLPGDTETVLYRIVQEAATNVTRYAAASHASILLRREGDTLYLEVEDNGRGFDVEEALSRGRLGLLGMRERAEMLGGTLGIASSPGQGTRLHVVVPLAADASRDIDVAGPAAASGDVPAQVASAAAASVQGAGSADAAVSEAASRAVELARAKALSDALVDIAAGMVRAENAEELLRSMVERAA